MPIDTRWLEGHADITQEGTKVNVTLCFSAAQAILAAKAGAATSPPFIGRLDDIATNGIQLIQDIVQISGNYDLRPKFWRVDQTSDAYRRLRPCRGRRRDRSRSK